MSDDSVQKGFIVRGRVQGVGFRWWTRASASELGLGGTVRNLVDGSVEVHLKGSASVVAEMEARLHRGPSVADVSAVEVVPSEQPLPDSFEVRF